MNRLARLVSLFVSFFALYALTAQRGLGWGDSGEFQHRILDCAFGLANGCESFATSHPLYVMLGKVFCSTPFQVTLLSSFFGAVSVVGFYLCTRKYLLSIVFGLSHMLWWLSVIAEVQTMNLAFTVFETWMLIRFLGTGKVIWMVMVMFLSGLHLEIHNFALLALPVYAFVLLRAGLKAFVPAAFAWCAGASVWIWCMVTRGIGDVLVGRYGTQVVGVLPSDWLVTGFNFALSGLSFFAPLAMVWWNRGKTLPAGLPLARWQIMALFLVNLVFFVRYFVPDQATFLLPTLFYAYLLISHFNIGRNRAISLAMMQVLLPVLACMILEQLPVPGRHTVHRYRNESRYFALPWKFNDDSADRCAAEIGGQWTGYPGSMKGDVR